MEVALGLEPSPFTDFNIYGEGGVVRNRTALCQITRAKNLDWKGCFGTLRRCSTSARTYKIVNGNLIYSITSSAVARRYGRHGNSQGCGGLEVDH